MAHRAVVFDLDGTLAVPDRDRQTLLDEATDATDAPSLRRDDYLTAHQQAVTGETRVPIFDRLLDPGEPSPEAVARAYREAVNDALEPVEEIEGFLADLRNGMGYRVGLLTDGPSTAQRSKLDRLGWSDAFDATLVTGELDTRKPDPLVFETICARLGVDLADAIYVGDNPEADIAGAADAGLATVQVTYEDGPSPHPKADAVVEREKLVPALRSALTSLSAPPRLS